MPTLYHKELRAAEDPEFKKHSIQKNILLNRRYSLLELKAAQDQPA
jgi:hypothetical protein